MSKWLVKGTARVGIHQTVEAPTRETAIIKAAGCSWNWYLDGDDPEMEDIQPGEAAEEK